MSVNKCILVGNLGKDPELRYTPAGVAVATFSMATTERFKDKEGTQQEKTEWHNIVVWRGLAEVCGKYLTKGKQVYIEGKIQTRSYDDRDGNKKYMTEIVADNMQMLSKAGGESDSNQSPQNNQGSTQGSNTGAGWGSPQNNNADGGGKRQTHLTDPPFNPDDDIPF